ncbi:uncharacterized protein KQ657_000586 [Scheffersomyces spartinae]|uniref:Zn(2)-C6 fungal-type domain-containing protein n=1 Tax=Scheffersomyces spartinae TaxID=45513 RepID=A0A9P7V967_9ASCO|nr:uncharacterized protein KQ657_000586 [Scheffersomyces spartinae]KAG7193519.1 hypothetical protein KQ657_000586 [Scheffersomyces spartinae]
MSSSTPHQRTTSSALSDCTPSFIVFERLLNNFSKDEPNILLPLKLLNIPRSHTWSNNNNYNNCSVDTPPMTCQRFSDQNKLSSGRRSVQTPCLDLRLVHTEDVIKPSIFIKDQAKTIDNSSLGQNSSSSNTSFTFNFLGLGAKGARKTSLSDSSFLIKSSPLYTKYNYNCRELDVERAIYSDIRTSSSSNIGFWTHDHHHNDFADVTSKWSQSTPLTTGKSKLINQLLESPISQRNKRKSNVTADITALDDDDDDDRIPRRVKRAKLYADIETSTKLRQNGKSVTISADIYTDQESTMGGSIELEKSRLPKKKSPPPSTKPSKITNRRTRRFGGRVKKPVLLAKKKGVRSKSGCWTCRIRHKACPEDRPECGQCTRLSLKCDYNTVRPQYMYDPILRAKKLSEIRAITTKHKNLCLSSSRHKRQTKLNQRASSTTP